MILFRLNRGSGAVEYAVGIDISTELGSSASRDWQNTGLMVAISRMYMVGHISPDGMTKKAYFFIASDASSLTAGNCI